MAGADRQRLGAYPPRRPQTARRTPESWPRRQVRFEPEPERPAAAPRWSEQSSDLGEMMAEMRLREQARLEREERAFKAAEEAEYERELDAEIAEKDQELIKLIGSSALKDAEIRELKARLSN